MRKIINLILFFTAVNVYSQNFMDHIIKADELYDEGKYKESVNEYIKAFEKQDGTMDPYYNAACSASLAGDKDQAFTWLQKSVEKGWNSTKYVENNPDFKVLRNDAKWDDLIEKISQNQSKINRDLSKELVQIQMRGQIYSDMVIRAFEKIMSADNERLIEIKNLKKIQDSTALAFLTTILDEKGWLGQDISGEKGNNIMFYILMGADLNTQEKYFPILQKEVEEGKANPQFIAYLQDEINLRKGQKQLYGTKIYNDRLTEKKYVRPLENPENVDDRRSKLELPSMNNYLKNWEMEWDSENYSNQVDKLITFESTLSQEQMTDTYLLFDFKPLDHLPLHPDCRSAEYNDKNKQCFSDAIQKHVVKKYDTSLVDRLKLKPGSIQKVFVFFEIDTEGKVENIRAIGTHQELEHEAIRVIKLLPKITSGSVKGTDVSIPYSLPITLKVSD